MINQSQLVAVFQRKRFLNTLLILCFIAAPIQAKSLWQDDKKDTTEKGQTTYKGEIPTLTIEKQKEDSEVKHFEGDVGRFHQS